MIDSVYWHSDIDITMVSMVCRSIMMLLMVRVKHYRSLFPFRARIRFEFSLLSTNGGDLSARVL